MAKVLVPGLALDELEDRVEAFVQDVLKAAVRVAKQAAESLPGTTSAHVSMDDLNVIPGLWAKVLEERVLPQALEFYTSAVIEQGKLLQQAQPVLVAAALPLPGSPIDEISESGAALDYLSGARNRLVGVGDELWSSARSELVAGMQLGESVPQLSKRVRSAAGFSAKRATMIARTEVIGASNKGSIDTMRTLGQVTQKEWINTSGPRTRPTHVSAGGQTVDLNANFVVGGASLDHPGDPAGPAKEIINCRCTMGFTLDDNVPEVIVSDPTEDPQLLNPAVSRQRQAVIEKKVNEARAAGKDTDREYGIFGHDGELLGWAPERAKLHKTILKDLYKQADGIPNEGRSMMSGGLGGAGKTTTLQEYLGVPSGRFMTVNPDDIKEVLIRRGMTPAIEGLSPAETAALVHEESSYLAKQLADLAYQDKKNITWDITMSSKSSALARIRDLRAAGYKSVDGVFVDIPVETSVKRVLSRHARGATKFNEGEGYGGRYVSPDLVRHHKDPLHSSINRGVFESLKDEFSGWELWDNGGTAPKRLTGGGNFTANAPDIPIGGLGDVTDQS